MWRSDNYGRIGSWTDVTKQMSGELPPMYQASHPHRLCRICVDGAVLLCRCSERAERHRWRSCGHPGPVLPHGSSREDPLCWACPQSLDYRGLWAHLHEGLLLMRRHFFNTFCSRLRQSAGAVQACLPPVETSDSAKGCQAVCKFPLPAGRHAWENSGILAGNQDPPK